MLLEIFPDHLKFSIIKPIHKKQDRMNPTNYRPISLSAIILYYIRKSWH